LVYLCIQYRTRESKLVFSWGGEVYNVHTENMPLINIVWRHIYTHTQGERENKYQYFTWVKFHEI